jgi:hypothetical protein
MLFNGRQRQLAEMRRWRMKVAFDGGCSFVPCVVLDWSAAACSEIQPNKHLVVIECAATMRAKHVHHQQPYANVAIHSLLVAASRRRHRQGCVGQSKVNADDEKRQANLQRQVPQEVDCTFYLCHVQTICCVSNLENHVLCLHI